MRVSTSMMCFSCPLIHANEWSLMLVDAPCRLKDLPSLTFCNWTQSPFRLYNIKHEGPLTGMTADTLDEKGWQSQTQHPQTTRSSRSPHVQNAQLEQNGMADLIKRQSRKRTNLNNSINFRRSRRYNDRRPILCLFLGTFRAAHNPRTLLFSVASPLHSLYILQINPNQYVCQTHFNTLVFKAA